MAVTLEVALRLREGSCEKLLTCVIASLDTGSDTIVVTHFSATSGVEQPCASPS
jgi:hypothetical protein